MSHVKDLIAEIEQRGFERSNVQICTSCFSDDLEFDDNNYIKNFIRKNGKKGKCSFCKDKNGKPRYKKVIPLERVMPIIINFADREFESAEENVPWDSEEQIYLGTVYDTNDLVEYIQDYLGIVHEELIDEIRRIINDNLWSYDKWKIRQEDEDLKEWRRFCSLLSGPTLSKLSAEQIISECYRERATDELLEIRYFLEKVKDYLDEFHMSETIRPYHSIYRCGTHITDIHDYGLNAIPASLVGTAPAKSTNDNRMSEAGDMMFYGAATEQVAEAEIRAKKGDKLTTGVFHTNKNIKILNLNTLYRFNKPSIFDKDNLDKRSIWFFLEEFLKQISVDKSKWNGDSKELYRTTQVFTKFIQRRTEYQGIEYRSSQFDVKTTGYREAGEECYVLFVTNHNCIEETDAIDKRKVQLIMEPNPKQKVV